MLRSLARTVYESVLERRVTSVPGHVAVIQDGNRRYARSKGEDPTEGHVYGAETTESLLDWAYEMGVDEITLYAFSTENFERDDDELERLFDIIADKLNELAESDEVHERRVRVRGVGDITRLPDRVRDAVDRVEGETEGYTDNRLNVALAYGGRNELLNAVRSVAEDVESGAISSEDVSEEEITKRLSVASEVDLVVRTGGERRTSNFLPWQARGGEADVYFSDAYWPEFDRVDFLRALAAFDGETADTEVRTRTPSAPVEGPAD